jgi:hypothetical protein
MKHITLAQLKKHDACTRQLLLFKQMFGDSVQVTEALAIEVAQQFDFDWAANKLLGESALAEYAKVQDLAWAEYHKMRDLAWAEYGKVCDLAVAEYHKVCASAFARLYIAQE